jgi:nucleoside-diphosphate-sugar epimerase
MLHLFQKIIQKKKRFLKKINYIKGNINNKNFLKKNIKDDFKYVVNLAGYVDHSKKKETLTSHYLGCKKLSRILLKKNIKSFVHIGSSMEYGHVKSPQKENSKCLPKSTYGKAKLLASKYLLDLFKRKNFPVTILRLYQVYGPYQDINRFIPIVINSCLKNKKFPCSHGNQYRDFLYIDDLISAIFLVLKNKNSNGKIINIGSAKPQKIKNVINMIVNYYKSGVPQFGKISLRKEEGISVFPDITNAKKILKWKPKFNFKNGLKRTIKFYNEKKK